ncbi:hypothetical protein RHMOL_Rhmol04G0046700 [Rhododendron molle]|uniref:Uncharacterized protein n=1 Tax=Rhododendron molle TaxID=49168 RepID=A0ACC0NYB7_RHOML|nr:hypothetical protein RHMOL_Rhmol04G0046700 [Rhododendron molle]
MDQKLYKAAKEGNVSCLSEEAMTNEDGIFFLQRTQHGNNIVHIAARAGRDTFVAEALHRFPFLSGQVNSQGDTPLLVAARFGHLQVVKTLADPNNELPMQDDMATAGESETNSRSSRHQRDMEKGLVDHQFKQATSLENGTNSREMTTTLENETNSSSSRRPKDVEEGLDDHQLEEGTIEDGMATAVENGTNSRDMATALENETNSSSSRRPRDVEEGLDDHQLDVAIPSHWRVTNEQSTIITTALHEALRNGHQEVARKIIFILITQKPHLMRQKDDRGKAAIHYAVEANYWVLVDQMLKAHASIALFPEDDGHIPLLRAASVVGRFVRRYMRYVQNQSRIPEILELLNVGDDEGNTHLHLAIKENDYEKAMLLSSSNSVDLGAVNKEGLTAFDLCQTEWKNLHKQADTTPSPDNLGVANLAKKATLRAFILSDTIAMLFSIVAVLALALAVYFEPECKGEFA